MKRNIIKLPKHLTENRNRLILLQRYANSLRAFYGLPIWLCGSALLEVNSNPRDWDIRVEMPDKDFALRFGDPIKWNDEGCTGEYTSVRWKWADECVKRTKQGWSETGLNIDFQIYPKSHCQILYRAKPKARLDTRNSM